jgi:hypothetical protein
VEFSDRSPGDLLYGLTYTLYTSWTHFSHFAPQKRPVAMPASNPTAISECHRNCRQGQIVGNFHKTKHLVAMTLG